MADVSKVAVYDSRVVQHKPGYAISKGGASVTNQPFSALSQSTSQHTYSVQVPSETTFVDRAINWTSTLALQQTVTFTPAVTLTNIGDFVRIGGYGEGWSWSAFPLHTLTSTIQASINDANVSINSGDVLKEVLRLTDIAANRRQRNCPTKLDKMKDTRDDWYLTDSAYGGYERATDSASVPNGAFIHASEPLSRFDPYCDSTGVVFNTAGAYGYVANLPVFVTPIATAGTTIPNGVLVNGAAPNTANISVYLGQDGAWYIQAVAGAQTITSLTYYVKQTFTEKLVLSPFVFSDIHEKDCGLFGIQNIQFTMNMRTPDQGRVVRQLSNQAYISTSGVPTATSSVSLAQSYLSAGAFSNSKVDVMFLSPPLDLPLSAVSTVPYLEYPRFTSSAQTVNANSSVGLNTPTLTLSQIPDLICIWARPQSYSATDGDYYLPITNISLQFDNYAGLLSTASTEELYEMSYNNGLHQSYGEWVGRVHTSHAGIPQASAVATLGGNVAQSQGWTFGSGAVAPSLSPMDQSVGGFLVLKPGKDFALSTGQAPGLVGNYVLSATCTVQNSSAVQQSVVLYVMTINSGFFQSTKGSSRVIKAPITEADVISSPIASYGTSEALQRAVGGMSGFLSKLGTIASKVLPMIPDLVGSAAPSRSGGRPSGGVPSGGEGGRKPLSKRLM